MTLLLPPSLEFVYACPQVVEVEGWGSEATKLQHNS
jgi:hypothetical protein